jgi:5-(carboxyamino)imidazole ribonucleotide synthase
VAPYRAVHSADELREALVVLGAPAILKTADFGYDGKGQSSIASHEQVAGAWDQLGRPVGVLEAFMPFSLEISVICARTHDGAQRCYGPVANHHVRHILDVTTAPAQLAPRLTQAALDLAQAIAARLDVVGLLAVEMFVVGDRLIVNELAPRPHNSGHYSFDACLTSQFEQQLRAVCGLPLGDVTLLRPAAMANLLGDLWQRAELVRGLGAAGRQAASLRQGGAAPGPQDGTSHRARRHGGAGTRSCPRRPQCPVISCQVVG